MKEIGERLVVKQNRALHREVGRVDLQIEPCVNDRAIFDSQRIADRRDIGVEIGVIDILECRCDDAWRRCGHESFAPGRQIFHEPRRIATHRLRAHIGDGADRLRRRDETHGILRRAAQDDLEKIGMRKNVDEFARLRLPAEACHPPAHGGEEPRAALLAVIDDIETAFRLAANALGHCRIDLRLQRRLVNGPSRLLFHEAMRK